MMNFRIRQFREDLINLVNQYEDIPLETKYMALQLVTNKIIELSNDVIVRELEEVSENAESTSEHQLGE